MKIALITIFVATFQICHLLENEPATTQSAVQPERAKMLQLPSLGNILQRFQHPFQHHDEASAYPVTSNGPLIHPTAPIMPSSAPILPSTAPILPSTAPSGPMEDAFHPGLDQNLPDEFENEIDPTFIGSDEEPEGDLIQTATGLVFRPLFAYRQQMAQKRRVYNYRYNPYRRNYYRRNGYYYRRPSYYGYYNKYPSYYHQSNYPSFPVLP